METLRTKEERHVIYNTLLQVLKNMIANKDRFYYFKEDTYISSNDGFCWMLPITEEFLMGSYPELTACINSLEFLTQNYPEIVPYLPECWPGLYIYYGDNPLDFRYKILKKLIQEWKP